MDATQASSSTGTPAAEFALDTTFVGRLRTEQHPDLAHLSIQAVDAGWDNALFRLGDHLPSASRAARSPHP